MKRRIFALFAATGLGLLALYPVLASTGVAYWSQTAGNNGNIDSAINFLEGMAPSAVNDSARALMASVAKYRDDNAGTLVTGGTSTAYTLTTNQGTGGTPPNGFTLSFKMNATNGTPATLAVDGGSAMPLRAIAGTDIASGILPANGVFSATYYTGSSEWVLKNIQNAGAGVSQVVTGAMVDYLGTTPPSGYVFLAGKTIGDGSSAATERANADTSALFSLEWSACSNTLCPVSGGRGASAAADFAAHKTLQLLDFRGRVAVGKDDMGGTAANIITNFSGTTFGQNGGEQSHILTATEMPVHNHAISDPGHSHTTSGIPNPNVSVGAGGAALAVFSSTQTLGTSTVATGISVQNAGSGASHNNLQPSVIVNKVVKL